MTTTAHESHYYLPSGGHETNLFTVLRAGWLEARAANTMQREFCPGDDIIYCLSGRGTVTIDGQKVSVAPGQLIWLPGDRPHAHATSDQDPWTVMWCRVQGQHLAALRERVMGKSDFRLVIKEGHALVRWFHELFACLGNQTSDTDLKLNTSISALLELMVEQKRIETKRQSPLNFDRAVAAMRADPAAPWTSADIESVSGISAAQIRRLFQRHMGQTPRAFLRSLRLTMAQKMMLETTLTLDEISLQCGFSDPYHFSKDFRRIVGKPPSEWRRIEIGGPL
jgi:AraC-like DNA-binding protein